MHQPMEQDFETELEHEASQYAHKACEHIDKVIAGSCFKLIRKAYLDGVGRVARKTGETGDFAVPFAPTEQGVAAFLSDSQRAQSLR